MKKKELITIIGISIVPFVLCCIYMRLQCYTRVARLTEEDLMWMNAYELGDTILFNGNATRDTLIVDYIGIENNSLPFSTEFFDWLDTYQGKGRIGLTLTHDKKIYTRNSFFILKSDESLPCIIRWNIMGLNSIDDPTDPEVVESYWSMGEQVYVLSNWFSDGTTVSLVDTEIDGISFDDCLIANMDNSRRIEYSYDSSDTLHATEFIWSKRYGLLQYRMEGETYTRTDLENLKSKPTGHKEPVNWMHSQTFRDLLKFIRKHSLV